MAFFQYLNFDGVDLPLPDSYEVDMTDREADSGGETEAGLQAVACSLALIMEVMRMQKKMVEEGKKRLNILLEMGLWDEVTKAFEKNGTTCLSEAKVLFGVCGINFTFDEMPEFKAIKEKFEKDYDCLVYYGVLTTTTIGQFLSLLFVSRYEEEWEDDRRELKEGYPYAYVWNREEEFGEIGSIQIKMEQGGLVRVA